MTDPYRERPELPPLPTLTPEEEAALELRRRRERGADQVLPPTPRPSRPVPLPLPGRGRPVQASPAGGWALAPGRPVHG